MDSTGTVIDLGAQIGLEADSMRLELVHAGTIALVRTVASGFTWGLYRVSIGTYALTVLALLLVTALGSLRA